MLYTNRVYTIFSNCLKRNFLIKIFSQLLFEYR